MTNYAEYLEGDARLCMLRELAKQSDGRLNEIALTKVLDDFGYRRSRDWVRTQMRKLDELGAVRNTEVGTVLVAMITRAGTDHVERRSTIDGVARPSPEA